MNNENKTEKKPTNYKKIINHWDKKKHLKCVGVVCRWCNWRFIYLSDVLAFVSILMVVFFWHSIQLMIHLKTKKKWCWWWWYRFETQTFFSIIIEWNGMDESPTSSKSSFSQCDTFIYNDTAKKNGLHFIQTTKKRKKKFTSIMSCVSMAVTKLGWWW